MSHIDKARLERLEYDNASCVQPDRAYRALCAEIRLLQKELDAYRVLEKFVRHQLEVTRFCSEAYWDAGDAVRKALDSLVVTPKCVECGHEDTNLGWCGAWPVPFEKMHCEACCTIPACWKQAR